MSPIKSKSPRILEALERLRIHEYADALSIYPYRYEDLSYTKTLSHFENGQKLVLLGSLSGEVKISRFGKRALARFPFQIENGPLLTIKAWNRPYMNKVIKRDGLYTLTGTYDEKGRALNLVHIYKGEIPPEDALRPLYHVPDALNGRPFEAILRKAIMEPGKEAEEIIPSSLREKYRLLPRLEALRRLHFPSSKSDILTAQWTLKYEEALLFELGNLLLQKDLRKAGGKKGKVDRLALERFIASLPFAPTSDQRKALREILGDMDDEVSMYRLLQGDVGTGKTLVAALSIYAAYTKGEQSALLAPTEALAAQHFQVLSNLFEGQGLRVALLTGSTLPQRRREILEDLEGGRLDCLVGTHAVFSKNTIYKHLGLAIIDEQHKFGVAQRRALLDKGEDVDLLLMSATPIPRTLALTIYGDLSVSTLEEFPGGKREVRTLIESPRNRAVYSDVKKAIGNGGRVYVVAPEIEEGKEATSSVLSVYKAFDRLFPRRVALMHGKRSAEEKEAALLSFVSGASPILVSTSLIEVGIDVKEANLMLVYDPTHFSLSSLHQLRGRIGRGGQKATFYLLYEGDDEEERKKLEVLVKHDDGFEIAEEDLRLRGPGDLMGYQQSGLPEFALCSIVDDYKIFAAARKDAEWILSNGNCADFAKIQKKLESKAEASYRA